MENAGFFNDDASQYWQTFTRSGDIEPERRLFAAVLDDAVKNYRKLLVAGGRRFVEEEAWLFSDDRRGTFSFCNVCDVLGLSPSRIRKSLRRPTAYADPTLPAVDLPWHRAPYRRSRKAAAAEARA